jgi:hypothetical protein
MKKLTKIANKPTKSMKNAETVRTGIFRNFGQWSMRELDHWSIPIIHITWKLVIGWSKSRRNGSLISIRLEDMSVNKNSIQFNKQ